MSGTRRAGVDVGGTWIRAVILRPNRAAKLLRRRVEPGRPPESVLRALLRGMRLDLLVVGSRGCWSPAPRRRLARRLARLAAKVQVVSDIELAHRAALVGGRGVVVVGGTGAAALAVNGRRRKKTGGRMPPGGDPGSAHWVGLRWSANRMHGAPDRARVAARAKKVLRRSALARTETASALAILAQQAVRGMDFSGPVPLSWQGGVFADAKLRAAFLKRVGRRFSPRPPILSPELCAALWDFC